MVNDKDIQEFINVLKNTVEYDKKHKHHILGKLMLTNKDMRTMCSNRFGKDYNMLSGREQRKTRERIFIALRGETDG